MCPIGELMFNREAWSGLCCASATASPAQHQDAVDGCSAEPAKGLILSQRHHQELRVWGTLGAVLNAQEQKELNIEVLQN